MSFGKDFLSIFTGGETSEQEKIRKAREKALAEAYAYARGKIGDQYIGPMQDDFEKIAELRNLMERQDGSAMSLTPEERIKVQAQIDQLERDVGQKLQFQPDYFAPTTEYDVEGYDPTRAKDISELDQSRIQASRFAAPEYEDAAMQAPSEAAKAEADAESLAAAKEALGSLEDVYQQEGMTAADKARLEQIQRDNAMQERAAREAIMSNLAERGMATSGNRVVALMNAAQNAANRNNALGLGVEINAEQRALNAAREAGALGRGLAQDEFGRKFQTGSAADEINRFNTLGARDVQAATRAAQDKYADWNRSMLERDAARQQANEANFAANQTAADQWLADQQNAESQWGANAQNQAGMFNTANQTAANQYNANRAWDQLMGYNTQQSNLGNLKLGEAGAWSQLEGQRPTDDYGQVVQNVGNFAKGVTDLFMDPGGAGSSATGKVGTVLNGPPGEDGTQQGGGKGGAIATVASLL